MRPILFIVISIILSPLITKAQLTDTSTIRKLSVNGFCLCKTTLGDLKQSYNDIKEVPVEEMDLAKGCFGQDSRYIAGIGYATDHQPGIIFQKAPESDYISKIRLTKSFKGHLPDGKYIDLNKLLLRDLFALYPSLKEKWGSRDCSDYWNFSNDTISFYVKVDKSKQPQFPINETYYLNKPVVGADLMASCYSFSENKTNAALEDDSNDPVFFIDSIRVNKNILKNYNPDEIALVTVYKGLDAIKRVKSATNGLIYIETKDFARERYWKYFKTKSNEYAKIALSPKKDTNIQYILNKKVLKDNFEGDLASINDTAFRGIQIIDKKTLEKDYGIFNMDYGVIIQTDPTNSKRHSDTKVQL